MLRPTRPAIILAAAAAALVASVPTAAATATPSTAVPDDWVVLEDDSGLLTVAVPADWDDTLTDARVPDDGTEQPRITASTDIDAFIAGFDVPGVTVVATQYTPDTPAAAEAALTTGCRSASDSRYDDGAFVGVLRHWTGCGFGENSDAEAFIVAAAPVNLSVTILLLVQITGPEDREIADGVLASFNLTHLPDPPPSTVPATASPSTTAPATTVPPIPTSPPASVATTTSAAPTTSPTPTTSGSATTTTAGGPATTDEPQRLRDDSGALEIEVPASWSDVSLRPATRVDGTELPNIEASPDLNAFLPDDDDFLTAGVIYRGLPYNADTEAELRAIGRLGCVDGGVQPYSDDLFTGHIWTFPSCGGTDTRQFIVVANPNDASFTALLVIRVTEPGNRELSMLLGSFTYDPAGVAGSQIAAS